MPFFLSYTNLLLLAIPSVWIFILVILAIGFIVVTTQSGNKKSELLREAANSINANGQDHTHSKRVGEFYDQQHDAFLKVYGDTIQAFRTTDITKLLEYQARSMGLKNGMKILDAGCGICGPAIYF